MSAAAHLAPSPASVGVDPEKLEALFERVARQLDDGVPACQVAVARRGRLAGVKSFGRARCGGQDVAVGDDTLFLFFSCTKALVAASTWLLLQEGQLDTSERVADIVPEFATNGKEVVSVLQLLIHTAGFPQAPYPQREWGSREQRLARFARWRLNWEPGSRFEYHPSSGFWVLAEIIERRSGLDHREFFRTRIAEPLGLPDLRIGLPREHQHRAADLEMVGEAPSAEQLARLGMARDAMGELNDDTVLGFNDAAVREAGVPGGGAVTTAGDLALFYQGLLGELPREAPALWKPETVAQATRIHSGDFDDPMFGKRANRGLGVVVAGGDERVFLGLPRTGSSRVFGHLGAGGQIGWADPESGLSFAYCTSGYDRDPLRSARRGMAASNLAAGCATAD